MTSLRSVLRRTRIAIAITLIVWLAYGALVPSIGVRVSPDVIALHPDSVSTRVHLFLRSERWAPAEIQTHPTSGLSLQHRVGGEWIDVQVPPPESQVAGGVRRVVIRSTRMAEMVASVSSPGEYRAILKYRNVFLRTQHTEEVAQFSVRR